MVVYSSITPLFSNACTRIFTATRDMPHLLGDVPNRDMRAFSMSSETIF